MTIVEAQTWRAYMARRGTLNLGLRIEQGLAVLASYIHQAHFKPPHPTMEDLMPHVLAKDDEPDDPMLAAKQAFQLLTDLARPGATAKKVKE